MSNQKFNNIIRDLPGFLFIACLIIALVIGDRYIYNSTPIPEVFYPFTWMNSVLFCALLIGVACVFHIKKQEHSRKRMHITIKEKVVLIVKNTCSGSWLDFAVVLTFFAMVSWIPDAFEDFVKDGMHPWRPLLHICALLVLIWGKPSSFTKEMPSDNEKTVLLTGMSTINLNNDRDTEITVSNVEPFIKPFEKYRNISKILVLYSEALIPTKKRSLTDAQKKKLVDNNSSHYAYLDDLFEYFDTTDKLLTDKEDNTEGSSSITIEIQSALKKLINAALKKTYSLDHDVEVIFSNPVDYNDFSNCNQECYSLVEKSMKECNINDDNIVVNITPGTSNVAAIMAFNAIKGTRVLVSVNQRTKALDVANLNVSLIQFDEWIDERAEG